MPVTVIHENMKRCLLNDSGEREAYLHPDDSLLLEGTTFKDAQTAASGSEGVTLKGTWNNAAIGQYVVNDTKNFFAKILSISGDTITVHYPMHALKENYGTTDGAAANKLVDSSATFTQDVSQGDMVALRDLSAHAIITSVDSDTELTLSTDLFPNGTKYSILPAFEPGDNVKIGTALLNGDAGQVPVEIPKFYYTIDFYGGKARPYVSPVKEKGLMLFPAFDGRYYADGKNRDFIYVGAFEGSITTARQFDAPQLIDYNLGSDKLTSLPGLTPVVYGQRSEFRSVAENRGAGWHQQDQAATWALQFLWMVEHETMDSQSVFEGITDWSGGQRDDLSYSSDSYALMQTGYTLRDGNNSVMAGSAPNASQRFSYRGVENFYGHLWKFVDGFNINNHKPYLSFNPADYADDTTANYIDLAVTMPSSSGYIDAIHNTPFGLIPASSNGSSISYLCDYYWQAGGWRVAPSGGGSATGDQAGFAALHASTSSSHRTSFLGSRACFR